MMSLTQRSPKPSWLKMKPPGGKNYVKIKRQLKELGLHTVCEEASCPNVAECWGAGTATIMILGDVCTRHCRFCDVRTGKPGGKVDLQEPERVAEAIAELGLNYVVLTSVDRDDLPDGGASHFAHAVEQIKHLQNNILVEVLIPDFNADPIALDKILNCRADVVGHNIEVVRRLTPEVRDRRCGYEKSLKVLKYLRDQKSYTKSSLMVGLGESEHEVIEAMDDLRGAGVETLTIGQYLRPSKRHVEVKEYITPEKFAHYETLGQEKGFSMVFSGPLVRSSYKAGEKFLGEILRSKNEKKI